MRGSVLQPGYLPWLGFFEQFIVSEVFVFLDDVQYTKQDWRNRNRIRTNTEDGWSWLTVPVKGVSTETKINEVRIDHSQNWAQRHLNLIIQNYHGSPHFERIYSMIKRRIEASVYLADLCIDLILDIADYLGIRRKIHRSSELSVDETDNNLRLIAICRQVDIDLFYDGKKAEDFLDVNLFSARGIEVKFQHYTHPRYRQVYDPFIPYLSVVDLLFNYGNKSVDMILQNPGIHDIEKG